MKDNIFDQLNEIPEAEPTPPKADPIKEAPPAPENENDLFNLIGEQPHTFKDERHNHHEEEEHEEEEEEHDRRSAPGVSPETAAKMVTFVADKGNAEACAFIAQEASEIFRLENQEKKELAEILAVYFEETGTQPAPGLMLLMAIAAIFGGKWAKAAKIRTDKNKRKRKAREAEPRPKRRQRAPEPEPEPEEKNNFVKFRELRPTPPAPKATPQEIEPEYHPDEYDPGNRQRFDIDKSGYFMFDTPTTGAARRLKVAERHEKAPPAIRQLKKEGRTNKDILSMIEQGKIFYL